MAEDHRTSPLKNSDSYIFMVHESFQQGETQKSEPNRTLVVFLTVYQIIIAMIVLTWTWNI